MSTPFSSLLRKRNPPRSTLQDRRNLPSLIRSLPILKFSVPTSRSIFPNFRSDFAQFLCAGSAYEIELNDQLRILPQLRILSQLCKVEARVAESRGGCAGGRSPRLGFDISLGHVGFLVEKRKRKGEEIERRRAGRAGLRWCAFCFRSVATITSSSPAQAPCSLVR